MSGTHTTSCARLLDCLSIPASARVPNCMSCFVCYRAVTASMEHFCQNVFAPREAMAAGSPGLALAGPTRSPTNCFLLDHGVWRAHWIAPTTPGQNPSGAMGRRPLALAPPLWLRVVLRL